MTTHSCKHCARTFGRHEHLVRHERTHTNEKPYRCLHCPQAFSRQDLLRRHVNKTHAAANSPARPTQPTQSAVTASSVFGLAPVSEALFLPTDSTCGPPPTPSFAIPETSTDSVSQSYLLPDTIPWLETLNSGYGSMNSFDLFGPFESPQSDQAHSENTGPLPESFAVDQSAAQQRSILSHPGSPLLTSNQSSVLSTQKRSLEMDDTTWNAIRREAASKVPTMVVPARNRLCQFIRRYFRSFHRHQPLLHEPTWSANHSPIPLVLAVCANGALYSLERENAVNMHRLALTILGPSDGSVQTLQTLMLLGAFAAWDDPTSNFDLVLTLHGRMTTALRRAWMVADRDGICADLSTWEGWLAGESLKRATYCIFTLLNLITIAFDIPSTVRLEARYGLPAHEAEWIAKSEDEWLAVKTHVSPRLWLSASQVTERLADDSLPVPSGIGMFGCHVLISCLSQKILCLNDASTDQSTSHNTFRELYLRLLRRWQVMWKNEPESTLSPDNPQGPILFNCTAILRVAYIRLVSDYSGVREAVSVGTSEDVAHRLTHAQVPRRDPGTARAALQACLALQIPVQLGFKVVSRTSFWVWSVQHALCYFECAIFLCKWCEGAASAQDLSSEEQATLQFLEQVVSTSGSTDGRSSPPAALHVQILRLWAELLDTEDTTVWRIMPRMAMSLRTYADSLSTSGLT